MKQLIVIALLAVSCGANHDFESANVSTAETPTTCYSSIIDKSLTPVVMWSAATGSANERISAAEKEYKEIMNSYNVNIVPRAKAQLTNPNPQKAEFLQDKEMIMQMDEGYIKDELPYYNQRIGGLSDQGLAAVEDEECKELNSAIFMLIKLTQNYLDLMNKMTAIVNAQITKWDAVLEFGIA